MLETSGLLRLFAAPSARPTARSTSQAARLRPGRGHNPTEVTAASSRCRWPVAGTPLSRSRPRGGRWSA